MIGLLSLKKPISIGLLGSLSGAGIWYITSTNSKREGDEPLTDLGILEGVKEAAKTEDLTLKKWEATISLIKEKITVEKLRATAGDSRTVTENQYIVPELSDEIKWGNIKDALRLPKNKSKVGEGRVFDSLEDAKRFCLEHIQWQDKTINLLDLTNESTVESLCIWDSRKSSINSQQS